MASGTRDSKGTKGQETRLRLLDTALAIVLEKGFSGTSIDEIIEAAEITKGGFFYHFRGKADLARALLERYLEQDQAFFTEIIERANELVEDPLQRVLLFLKLFAEAVADLPDVHPGCLVASYTYESQQFDPEVRDLCARGVKNWRDIFRRHLEPVVEHYPMAQKVDIDDLADQLISIMEGGIILSRLMKDPRIFPQQVLQYRSYIQLLFTQDH